MHLCIGNLLAATLFLAAALRHVRRLLPDRQIHICREAFIHFLDDLLEVGVPLILFDALEDLRDKQQVRNEPGCRQEKRVLSHVVAQAPHHLLVESDHVSVRLQLPDVAVVVAAASAGVRHRIAVALRWHVLRDYKALEELILPILLTIVMDVVAPDQLVKDLPDFLALMTTKLQ